MPDQLENWAERLHCKTLACVCVPVLVIAAAVGTAVTIALSGEVQESPCDADFMKYAKLRVWQVPRKSFNGADFNEVVKKIVHATRTEIIPAERQTAVQKSARLCKSCEDIVTQDTDYTPRIRGYMRDMELPWPHRSNRNDQIAVEVMIKAKLYWSWPSLVKIEFTDLGNGTTQVLLSPSREETSSG
ncbi:uncharacterized protein LOC144159950 [Haemaphysalis longicornis]